jgi:hypothetical protein
MYRKDGLEGMNDKPQPGNHHKLTKHQQNSVEKAHFGQLPNEQSW